jgi:hypothetical protein
LHAWFAHAPRGTARSQMNGAAAGAGVNARVKQLEADNAVLSARLSQQLKAGGGADGAEAIRLRGEVR